MKTLRFSLQLLLVALLVLAFSSVASAQATRTWVSGVGDDANPCSRTAPCKTFAGAISKTAVGGEIDCLDPGGFGAVTITKSITINCDAGPGGILPGVTNAVNINAPGGTVTLRALDLQGVGQGIIGVNVINAANVHLVDMNIYGFTGSGVNVASSTGVFLTVEDTRIHECANGVQANNIGSIVEADLNRVSIWAISGSAVLAQNGSRVTLHNSTVFFSGTGVNQTSVGAQGSVVMVFNCDFNSNGNALNSISGAQIGVSGSLFYANSIALNANGGSISSSANNIVFAGPPGMANGPALVTI